MRLFHSDQIILRKVKELFVSKMPDLTTNEALQQKYFLNLLHPGKEKVLLEGDLMPTCYLPPPRVLGTKVVSYSLTTLKPTVLEEWTVSI